MTNNVENLPTQSNNVKNLPVNPPRIDAFYDVLTEVVYGEGSGLNIVEIIGCMELIKADLLDQAREDDET